MYLGEKIRMIRDAKGIKQEDMARELGMTQQNYSNIESGKTKISIKKLDSIACKFKMTTEYILSICPSEILNGLIISDQDSGNQTHINDIKKLYEDKIALLEETKNMLKSELEFLRSENTTLKGSKYLTYLSHDPKQIVEKKKA